MYILSDCQKKDFKSIWYAFWSYICILKLTCSKEMRKQVDFLVIGSGIAGLFYATKVSKYGRVAIICKNKIDDTSTVKAQGGIASVMNSYDSFEKHIEDTMIAGCGINNRKIVEIVVREAPERIRDLVEIGTNFDTDSTGQYDMNREGGHSEKRILHFKDKTGAEIQRALVQEARNNPNIDIYEDHFAIELITQHHLGVEVTRATPDIKCYGAYVYDVKNRKVFNFFAKKTLIATGGCGNAYMSTTNPVHITGDGIAMVYRAKGAVENMEFVQFHPLEPVQALESHTAPGVSKKPVFIGKQLGSHQARHHVAYSVAGVFIVVEHDARTAQQLVVVLAEQRRHRVFSVGHSFSNHSIYKTIEVSFSQPSKPIIFTFPTKNSLFPNKKHPQHGHFINNNRYRNAKVYRHKIERSLYRPARLKRQAVQRLR